MKHAVYSLLFVAVAALLGCGTQKADNEIRIGHYSSMTGTTATFGQSSDRGVRMAIEETNAAGGVLGKTITLITEDTQSKPEEAPTAVTKLISRDKVSVLIGEIASSRSLAAAPIAQTNKIPMVSPGSTNPAVTEKGDYIFRVCYIDPFQGEVIAKFAFNSLNVRKVAILKDVKNDYSVGLAQFFTQTFTGLGGEVLAEEAYSEGDADFRAQLTTIKSTNPEAVIVPGYYQEAALIVKQARELNMTCYFLGGDGWDSAKLLEVGGDAMNGTFFTNHYAADDTTARVQEFVNKYKAKYNETPDAMAVLGYDAAKIVIDAIGRAGVADPLKIRDALATTQNYQGVSGLITIDEQRNARKSVVIVAVQDGGMHYYATVNP